MDATALTAGIAGSFLDPFTPLRLVAVTGVVAATLTDALSLSTIVATPTPSWIRPPVTEVSTISNCSSGSSALYLAWQAVTSGALDCVLVVGFEQMLPGPMPT